MIFSQRDVDALRLLCWCQFIRPKDLDGVVTETERQNLIGLGLVRIHEKSRAMVLTNKGTLLLERMLDGAVPQMSRAYHAPLIERRVRVSRLAITGYHSGADLFTLAPEELSASPSMFLPTITRSKGSNPWGSTRVAAIAHLGNTFYAMH